MKQKTVKKTIVATQIALLLGSAFSFTTFANELDQVARPSTAEQDQQKQIDNDVEVIQVTGIRGSLRDNLNNKRFSDAIVDSINTEDIAKNPDRNMAEALQRVPGVQITNEFGEGSQVSIRGTAPQFTNTLLNGQSLESAASLPLREESASFDFSSMSADQISKIEVFKSPQANLPAGGIGGTVILHTKKPLERENHSGYLKAEANYNDAYDKTSPQMSGLYNWINEEGSFGTSLNLSYQEVNTQRDGNEAIGGWYGYYRNDKPNQINNSLDDNNVYNTSSDTYEKPGAYWGIPNSARFFREKKRLNGTLAFQYQPTDELNFNLDYTYNYNDNDNESHAMLMRNYYLARWAYSTGEANSAPGYDVDRIQDLLLHAQGNVNDITAVNSQGVRYGDPINNLLAMEFQDRDGSDASNDQLNFTVDYQFDDVFVKFQVGRSTSESYVSDFGTEFNLNFQEGVDTGLSDVGVYYDYDADSNTPGWGVTGGAENWLANPTSEMYLNGFFKREQFRENNENYFQGDITWSLDNEFYITSIESGFKIRKKSSQNSRYLANSKRGEGERIIAGELASGTISGVRDGVGTFPQAFFDVDKNVRDDIWQNDHLVVDNLDNCEAALAADGSGYRGCRTGFQEEQAQFYDQGSDINEAYIMANIGGGKWRGNIGVRFVDTERSSLNYQSVGVDELGNTIWQPVSTQSDTQDVLPSMNLSYNLTDELVIRTAASKVIDHPSLAQLRDGYDISGTYNDQGAVNEEDAQRVGVVGNPDLASYQANQFELGLEWYFTDSSLVGITAFYKDLKNIIRSQTSIRDLTGAGLYTNDGQLAEGEYAITSNYNVGEQQINGYEVQLQHDFGNGFGVQGNYTFINVPDEEFTSQDYTPITETDDNGDVIVTGFETDTPYTENVRSEGNSKHTGNAQVYFENESFSARLSYNYRSQYFVGPDSQSDLVVDDRQSIDMKLTYQITENIMSTFSVTNLLDEAQEYYFIRKQIEVPEGGIPQGQEAYYTQRKEKVAGNNYTTGRNFYVGLNWNF
ncbi:MULTISPECIES: TonB-dependent receptor [Pseudoalteromonas]|uniref:TonB-dependent receptor n=1 Tax=Pseudoalteromonas TaxID=53246 RepID=UPI0002F51931|nr:MULTISPECIES: TonB-dependent receptor [Pseudoalteromonas]MCF6145187.1 hypothetical protein [Pseudoalteromonas mariniglutinosa NCIMB 1770]